MKGRTIIIQTLGDSFWQSDSKRKNARGKKPSWAKCSYCRAEMTNSSYRDINWLMDISKENWNRRI